MQACRRCTYRVVGPLGCLGRGSDGHRAGIKGRSEVKRSFEWFNYHSENNLQQSLTQYDYGQAVSAMGTG
jgi:hypothetical protein